MLIFLFKGKGYASSEVRFVEIQEKLCTDVERGEMQCHDNHHAWEEHLEEWWKVNWNSGKMNKPIILRWFMYIDKCMYKAELLL